MLHDVRPQPHSAHPCFTQRDVTCPHDCIRSVGGSGVVFAQPLPPPSSASHHVSHGVRASIGSCRARLIPAHCPGPSERLHQVEQQVKPHSASALCLSPWLTLPSACSHSSAST